MKREKDNNSRIETIFHQLMADRKINSVVAGISGGADSTALLLLLCQAGITVHALHCNFHLRGDESDRDMQFVEKLCAENSVPLTICHFDTEGYARKKGISIEMACRELRYEKFRELLKSEGADRIVVAHNADDQAETVLLNLMRGSGIAGMRGMLEDTGEILRPLLGISRREILDYLEEKQQNFITDSSNGDSKYMRNFLRNEVLPLLETRWPHAKEAIYRTSNILADEEKILESVSQAYNLRKWAMHLGANPSQCEEMIKAVETNPYQSGKKWIVVRGRISAERDRLEFIPDDTSIDFKVRESAVQLSSDEIKNIPLSKLVTTLSPEKLIFRHPQEGDKIRPLGMSGSIKVSKVMKDAKLSQAEKERIVVAATADNGEIIWVEGLKRSRSYLAEGDGEGAMEYVIEREKPAKQSSFYFVKTI